MTRCAPSYTIDSVLLSAWSLSLLSLPFLVIAPAKHSPLMPSVQEIDFNEVVGASLPACPRDVSLQLHWLAIEGVQPAIPQNPSTGTVPTFII